MSEQSQEQTSPDAGSRVNVEAIMDIPLEISVEMGRVKLPLATVSRFAKGSIIDLNKEVNANVHILANGRVFATGEIVSADGKLGVRIVDIVSAGNRIRVLGT